MRQLKNAFYLFGILFGLASFSSAAGAKELNIVETAVKAGKFKTLATALTKAELVDALQAKGPFTVFAPTDAAFAKLPKGTVAELIKPENKPLLTSILTYHVVPGKYSSDHLINRSGIQALNGQQLSLQVKKDHLFVNKSQVVQADISCSNGTIHVIDSVLMPSSDDIIATAVNAGNFKTLATALKTAGLIETLKGKGPFTVFAPTDKAFGKLPKSTLNGLLQRENRKQLIDILKYHVVPGRVYAAEVLKKNRIKTLQGEAVHVSKKRSGAYINNSKILATDVDASNGVIHVIDSVLLPPKARETASPREMIISAINRGAPLYNHGRRHACMTLYMQTAEKLLDDYSSMMPAKVRSRLSHAAKMATNRHMSTSDRAWTLRHALDAALDVMPTASR